MRAAGVDTLIIAGCTTSVCVRATTIDAMQRGFRPLVAAEAVGDYDASLHAVHLRDLDARYADVMSVEALMAYLETGTEFFASPWVNAPWALLVGFMMISRVPTYSFKRIKVHRDMVIPVLLLTGLYMAALVLEPWITLAGSGLVYIGMMPFGARAHRQMRRRQPEPPPLRAPLSTTVWVV